MSYTARMSVEFDLKKEPQSTKLQQKARILVKLNFGQLCNSKLSGLCTLDNMVSSLS